MATCRVFNIIELSVLLTGLIACHGDHSKAVRGKDNVATATLPPEVIVSSSATPPTVPLTCAAPILNPVPVQTPVDEPSVFRLVGIITGSDGRMALLEDQAGAGYTVKMGSRVGRSEHIVRSIGMDDIILSSGRSLERIQLGN